MSSYSNFIKSIPKLTKLEYYEALVLHKEEILRDIHNSNQGVVAKKLNLTSSKLNILLLLLRLNLSITSQPTHSQDGNNQGTTLNSKEV